MHAGSAPVPLCGACSWVLRSMAGLWTHKQQVLAPVVKWHFQSEISFPWDLSCFFTIWQCFRAGKFQFLGVNRNQGGLCYVVSVSSLKRSFGPKPFSPVSLGMIILPMVVWFLFQILFAPKSTSRKGFVSENLNVLQIHICCAPVKRANYLHIKSRLAFIKYLSQDCFK